MTIEELGECFAMPLTRGRWGACQSFGRIDGGWDTVVLDWVGDHPPTLSELRGVGPMRMTHHFWRGQPMRQTCLGVVPTRFRRLGGSLRLGLSPLEKSRSFGLSSNLPLQVDLQRWWDEEVPENEKHAYLAEPRRRELTIGPTTLEVGGRVVIGDHPHAWFPFGADEPVPWEALNDHGVLDEIVYYGRDPRVLEYVGRRALVTKLRWYGHGRDSIDAADTALHELTLDVSSPLSVSVPVGLRMLTLSNPAHPVRVVAGDGGRDLCLVLAGVREVFPSVEGLDELTSLEVNDVSLLDVDRLGAYPMLCDLTARGRFGTVANASSLKQLRHLDEVALYDFYTMDAESFPAPGDMPSLRSVTLSGLRRSDAKVFRKKYRRLAHREIVRTKNDAWIAANADNPLRDWVDDDERAGKRACKLYAKAFRAVSDAQDDADAQKALLAFVRGLNRVEASSEMIDTLRREEAAEAYARLVGETAIDPEVAFEWFDLERDF